MVKENNYDLIRKMIFDDKTKTINFLNNLSNESFCSVMFTNAIFAIIYPINILPHININKKIELIELSKKKGFDYIHKTLCEKCDNCFSYLYPGMPIILDENDNNEISDKKYKSYLLWNDQYDSHSVFIDGSIYYDLLKCIKTNSISEYSYKLRRLIGRMSLTDLRQSYTGYSPNDFMEDIVILLQEINKSDSNMQNVHILYNEEVDIDLEYFTGEYFNYNLFEFYYKD